MVTVLEECIIEEQSSVVFFSGQKNSMQRILTKKCFPFMVGSVLWREAFHNRIEEHGKRFADDEEVETEVRKWLRQQSRYFYAAGFDALVKRWNKCISVGGRYVEK
jgi:hypothetical protein